MKHLNIINFLVIFAFAFICQANETALTIADISPRGFAAEANEDSIPELASLGVPGYAIDYTSNKFTSFNVVKEGTFENIDYSGIFIPGADFLNGDFSTLYGVTYYSNTFIKFNTQYGYLTVVGPCVPDGVGQHWTGMAGHPNGTLYACSYGGAVSKLYTIDPDTGTPYLRGVISNYSLVIAIAINAQGDIYGLDLIDDNLILIDENPVRSTVIGNIGFDANQSQGMDFDEKTGILYLSAFNETEYRAEIRVADLETGNTTLLYPVGDELFKLDSLAIATYAGAKFVPSVSCFAPNTLRKSLSNFLTDDPGMLVNHGSSVDLTLGADFLNGDFSKLYGVTYFGNEFVTISTNGTQTVIGPCAPEAGQVWTGISADPDGTLYACSTSLGDSKLYTINPATGVPTLIGQLENCPGISDIAISPCGQMYGIDIVNNNLVRIDKTTGNSSVLGFLDFDINFSQGMDFDDENGLLYLTVAAIYNWWDPQRYELRIADTNTGHTTLIGVIGDGYEECGDIGIVSGGGSALKIYSLKVADKGAGKSSFSCKAGYNWPGQMPVTSLSLALGNYSDENIAVTAKGKKFMFESGALKGTIDPQKHLLSFKARKTDPIGTTTPDINIKMYGPCNIFGQQRQVTLDKGKYKENTDLANQLFFVDKASITDSSKVGSDKVSLTATLNGKTTGADTGFSISIIGENGVILTQTLAAAEFDNKNDTFVYTLSKGSATPIDKVTISLKKKNVTVKAGNFLDMADNALGTAMDPLVTVTLNVDFATWSGGGTARVRFNQKSAGKAKF